MTRNDEVPGVIPTPCLKRVPLSKTREAVLSDPARLGAWENRDLSVVENRFG